MGYFQKFQDLFFPLDIKRLSDSQILWHRISDSCDSDATADELHFSLQHTRSEKMELVYLTGIRSWDISTFIVRLLRKIRANLYKYVCLYMEIFKIVMKIYK